MSSLSFLRSPFETKNTMKYLCFYLKNVFFLEVFYDLCHLFHFCKFSSKKSFFKHFCPFFLQVQKIHIFTLFTYVFRFFRCFLKKEKLLNLYNYFFLRFFCIKLFFCKDLPMKMLKIYIVFMNVFLKKHTYIFFYIF